jgi:hypothetical protein
MSLEKSGKAGRRLMRKPGDLPYMNSDKNKGKYCFYLIVLFLR